MRPMRNTDVEDYFRTYEKMKTTLFGNNNIVTYNNNSSSNGIGDVKLNFYETDNDNVIFNLTLEGRDSAYPHLFQHSFVIYVLGGAVDEK